MDVFEDNKGVIKLVVSKHAINSRSAKLTDIAYHLVRNPYNAGKVVVVYVRTEDQLVDLFTKPLGMQKFYRHAIKTALNIVLCDSNNEYAVNADKLFRRNGRLL